MKNFALLSLFTVLIVVASAFIFYGCKKDDQEVSTTEQMMGITQTTAKGNVDFKDPNTYGILHNEIAEYVLRQDVSLIDKAISTEASIDAQYRTIDLCISYCLKAGYLQNNEVCFLKDALYEFVGRYGQSTLKIYESEDFFVDLLSNAGFSKNMIDALLLIRKTALPLNSTAKEMDQVYVNILEENPYQLNSEELFQIKVGQSITSHSRQFWTEEPYLDLTKPGGLTCDEWGIVMDAVGAILGSPFGPIGSAILSASMSIAAKRDCQRMS